MKFLILIFGTAISVASFAKESGANKIELRQPASVSQQQIICTVGDGKEGTTPKTVVATLDKSGKASIDQEIGDYRVMAFWMPQVSKVSIGVIEKVSGTTASTMIGTDMQVGSLFASKNGQSVDLNCYIK